MSTQSQNAQKELHKTIVELFDINKLPEEKQEETINKIGTIIFQAVLMRVLPLLEKKDLEEYEKLMEYEIEPDELYDFFFAKVPMFLQIMGEEAENFRKESAQILNQIK